MTRTPNDAAVGAALEALLRKWYSMGLRRPLVEALIAAARAQGEREGLRRAETEIACEVMNTSFRSLGDQATREVHEALLAISGRVRRAIDALSSGGPSPQKEGG